MNSNLINKKAPYLIIEGKEYPWDKQFVTGAEVRSLAGIAVDAEVYLSLEGLSDDELIQNDTKVDLNRTDKEHFYIKKALTLVVNGRPKPWTEKKISFEQVVILAFGQYNPNPNIVYTVTYDGGPRQNQEGSMVRGDVVRVKNKMVFNVTATDKS